MFALLRPLGGKACNKFRNSRAKLPHLPSRVQKRPVHQMYAAQSWTPLTESHFDDPKVFTNRSTLQLLFNYAILRSCAIDPLVTTGTAVLNFMERFHIAKPAHWLIKQTYYRHFVAGQDLTESVATASQLSKAGIGTILDYSVESENGNVDEVVQVLIDSIRTSGAENFMPFSCFKISGLVHHHLLRRIDDIFDHQKQNPQFKPALELLNMANSDNYVAFANELIKNAKAREMSGNQLLKTDLPKPGTSEIPPPLTVKELETMFLPFVTRLERLGEACRQYDQAVLIDAEQSWFQETIHFAARCLMSRYNKQKPLIYNTYQMYLKESPSKLQEDITYAKQNGLVMGAKIVRGAYMDAEAAWAKQRGCENPVFPTIDGTHNAYNTAVGTMLDLAKNDEGAVVIASHNEQSMVLASQGLFSRSMPSDHPLVHFGQLYGMCDHMSLALAHNGHNVVKYVPFGPVEHVMPYLLRRVAENRGFLASTKKEQRLMLEELKSRVLGVTSRQTPQRPLATL